MGTLGFLKYVPKNMLSRYIGNAVHWKLPKPFAQWSVKTFAEHYKLNLEEAEFQLEHYKSIGDLFTRRLKPGARPITGDFVHPVDGVLSEFGAVEHGRLIQAKGIDYSVEGLTAHDLSSPEYASFMTYYLCPTDYHRVHSPFEGRLLKVVHVPGNLWPVNEEAVTQVPYLFSVNERVIMFMETLAGPVAVVMVGATNVGKITLSFDSSIVTNQKHKKLSNKIYDPPIPIRVGEELGVFNMGSTVILLLGKKIQLNSLTKGPVKLGQSVDFSFR